MSSKTLMSKAKKLADALAAFKDDETVVRDLKALGTLENVAESVAVTHGVLADVVVACGGPAWSEDEGWVR